MCDARDSERKARAAGEKKDLGGKGEKAKECGVASI